MVPSRRCGIGESFRDGEAEVVPRTTRLTIWIDRADMSRTQSALFAPDETPSAG